MSEKLVLGYWGIRGRGQILRHILSYTGIQFDEKIYKTPDEYGKDIATLGNFPNLPYLRDGQFVFTETLGIARYIVRRAGRADMLGQNPRDEAIMDNFMYAFDDIFAPLIAMLFNKKVMDIKTGHYYKIKSNLQRFEKFIGGKDYIIGYITIADFFLAEYSHYVEKLYPEEFTQYKNIKRIRENIQSLQEVKNYYSREKFVLTPFLPPNKTAIPFFWPGTEVAVPAPVQKPFVKKVVEVVKNVKVEKHEEPAQQQKIQAQEVPEQNWENQVEFYAPQAPHKVAVISGSVSSNSPINYFMGVITGIGHPAFEFSWCDISTLEIHNEDIDEGTDNANSLRGQVYEAEAVLIGVSQTNHMVSTVLTNAYNWLAPVLKEKPIALVSIQSSQDQFRKALTEQGMPYMKSAKLTVQDPGTFFNAQGSVDGPSLNRVKHFFNKFAEFIETGN